MNFEREKGERMIVNILEWGRRNGRQLCGSGIPQMRNSIATDGAAVTPVQVQTTLDNWYKVQLRRRRRLKRGSQRNRGRDERRKQTLEHKIVRTEGGK
jgi:hypothetical protein